MGEKGLQHGRLGASCRHVCVDMQRIFVEPTDWHTPWAERVLPVIECLAAARPEQTVFTRFIPARRPEEAEGTWRRYYERWRSMTLEALPPGMVELAAPLARLVPPAGVFDKPRYSPWWNGTLHKQLRQQGVDALVVSGAETDVCVLATVLGAVDLGYRVVIATDALCSSSDETHDALLTLYRARYGSQVETATTEEVLGNWT